MRIVVHAVMELEPGKRDDVLRASAGDIAASLAEPGCLFYDWGADLLNPNRIIVFEEWESADDLATHFKAPAYLSMGARLNAAGITSFLARKFSVDQVGDIYDAEGIARADFF